MKHLPTCTYSKKQQQQNKTKQNKKQNKKIAEDNQTIILGSLIMKQKCQNLNSQCHICINHEKCIIKQQQANLLVQQFFTSPLLILVKYDTIFKGLDMFFAG